MQQLTLSTTLMRKPDLVHTDMDGDTVMMSIERGEYYGIGGVGSHVWEMLEKPVMLADIVKAVCSEYDVDEATCQADMRNFVGKLLENDLVTVA